jgi:diguanylate cyclase (GGDEF)-like protein/hemerythrin-like metal-binding protein
LTDEERTVESFVWNQTFETGLAEVDKQHHHLVDVINQFGNQLVQVDGVSHDDLENVLQELVTYAKYHFSAEQAYVEQIGLDPRHTEHHHEEHVEFLNDVTLFEEGISRDKPDAARPLLSFLIQWLTYHILGSDQSMARQVRAVQGGQNPARAFEAAEQSEQEGPNGALLSALNVLFQQVTERNRELLKLNRTLESRVEERTRELAVANRNLEELSLTDMLSGLPNRRHAMRGLARSWAESVERSTALSCMMIDADNFKAINDTHGHDAGDEVLRELSRALRDAVRTDDMVCRLGGDEFFVVCPNTPFQGAMKLAEDVRRKVATLRVPAGTGQWVGSISVGVATRQPPMDSPDQLVKSADEGVYAAKRSGRNCVASGS